MLCIVEVKFHFADVVWHTLSQLKERKNKQAVTHALLLWKVSLMAGSSLRHAIQEDLPFSYVFSKFPPVVFFVIQFTKVLLSILAVVFVLSQERKKWKQILLSVMAQRDKAMQLRNEELLSITENIFLFGHFSEGKNIVCVISLCPVSTYSQELNKLSSPTGSARSFTRLDLVLSWTEK